MRRAIAQIVILLSIFICTLYAKAKAPRLNERELKVVIAYNPTLTEDAYVLDAYKSVLEEEGVPLQTVSLSNLMSTPPADIVKHTPAIILPDGVSQIVPEGFPSWLSEYVENGGNTAIIYDVGVKDQEGNFLPEAALTNLVGINYTTYDKLLDDAYTIGYLQFKDNKSRDYFEIPLGKVVEENFISSYGYGALEYPIAKTETRVELKNDDIYAYVLTKNGEIYPALVIKNHGKGKLLYVNLPLGYLKGFTDDLPLRAIIRTFLFKEALIPHLVGSPYAKGGIVWNWHVDDRREWEDAKRLKRDGVFRKDIKYSIHITAGDFVVTPEDEMGFDACSKGRKYVKKYKKYGVIGSHGGWCHDWFADNIIKGNFGEKEIEEYIAKNNKCLESIINYKITEYSAPVGTHPQPTATKILEKLGIIAYYYTGDSGSAPNRSFVERKMVSNSVIAFPIMPFGKAASFWELEAVYDISEQDVKQWLIDTADYAAKNAFKLDGNGLEVSLKNPDGLDGIAVAIPKNRYKKPDDKNIKIEEDNSYYYLIIGKKTNAKVFHISTY
ncbi:MAG: hypothetical protein QXU67_04040 [Candidatus Bathyarchaeia archaeon]